MSGSVTGIIHDRSSSQSTKKLLLIESAVKNSPEPCSAVDSRGLGFLDI